MSLDDITVEHLVDILKTVPEQTFRITQLAPELLDEDGQIDIIKCVDEKQELNLAIAELRHYVKGSKQIRGIIENVGRNVRTHVIEDWSELGDLSL